MDILDLRIFARVAAVQNLSAVGAELGLTPGTISKRVQALEDEVKARLFDRTTRSIRITAEGSKFLEHANRILQEFEQMRSSVGASAERPAGKLKISAPAALSQRVVAPALVGFCEAYPEIEVRIDITDRIVNLHEEGYDAAIRVGTLTDSSLIAKRLAPDRIILVAAPAYLKRRGAPRLPSEVAMHDCLLCGDSRSWQFARGQDHDSVRVSGRLQSDNGELLHRAAVEGLGLLRTSEIAASEDLALGRLVRVLPDYELAGNAAIWAVYPSAKHVMLRLRLFLDHLAACCRDCSLPSPANDQIACGKAAPLPPDPQPDLAEPACLMARPAQARAGAGRRR